ncbi:type II toxin-antitoxin system HipA family toxin [Chlorobium sp. KB01]|uniref:type II toxin-antitoxin system HipA family toxin n=1 Tax=Chlorobium sp. KB01 TaxID=1917528 RepID=UPI0009757A74|nr:HipA domain-containing protein [Chlorobium sp. KB01]
MPDVEVYIDWQGSCRFIGRLHRQSGRGREKVSFEYDNAWIEAYDNFSIDASLKVGRGVFVPRPRQDMFGTLGDSSPDQWGRRLMRRAERRRAEKERSAPRTLFETDYLLGVVDETRLGALRFKYPGEEAFLARTESGVPKLIELGKLLGASERILRDEESDEDLMLIFAPGSSLGGARPKASVIDQYGHLSIAKFPKENDEYSIETWEEIALRLAEKAGIQTPIHELVRIADKAILLSRRFDRNNAGRIPFMSAMSMTGSLDGEGGSYLDIVDALGVSGAQAKGDRADLFRRMVFNVLISNVDDHLRNHGFLMLSRHGWTLSPVYDLNPTPQDLKPRVLSTNIDFEDGTCSIELVQEVASQFGLHKVDADRMIADVARATQTWCEVAKTVGARSADIKRMESAFEHDDLYRALRL